MIGGSEIWACQLGRTGPKRSNPCELEVRKSGLSQNNSGNTDEGRGKHADYSTRDEIEAIEANEAFQLAAHWSGRNVIFQSDSEPTLLMLMEMYAETKERRYNISEDFDVNPINTFFI